MRAFLAGLPLVLALAELGCPSKAPSEAIAWSVNPGEASRVARVEAGLPEVFLPGEAPLRLSIEEWMVLLKIPGLSLTVIDDNRVVWAKSYGVREAGGHSKVTLDTPFQAASISKPITVLAALHEVEAGRLNLDANVNDRLRAWRIPDNTFTRDQKVTLRRIMSHTAGLTTDGFEGYPVGAPLPTVAQILDGVAPANSTPVGVNRIPGSGVRYSGGGTVVLQLVLTELSGQPFPEFMDRTVLRPLGMRHSTYEQPPPPGWAGFAALGHKGDGRPVPGGWHVYPEMGPAGLWSTPLDLAAVAIEVVKSKSGRSNRILSRPTTQQMLTPQNGAYGLGFYLGDTGGPDRFGHTGANEGFESQITAYATCGKGFVVMGNADWASALFQLIEASIAKEYGWPGYSGRGLNWFTKFRLLVNLRGLDHALAAFKSFRAGPEGPTLPYRALDAYGWHLMNTGLLEDAFKVLSANLDLFPDEAGAHESMGDILRRKGHRAEAAASYRKALALDPGNSSTRKKLQEVER